MATLSPSDLQTFTSDTRAAFQQYLSENPNSRRITSLEKNRIIEWLTTSDIKLSSQKEQSRRNYVRKTFTWDESSGELLARAKTDKEKPRTVVLEDSIMDVIQSVHEQNGHLGWDATWKAISSRYYGILRADLIYLLKRCQICVRNPSKRPKGSTPAASSSPSVNPEALYLISPNDAHEYNWAWDVHGNGDR